MILTIKGADFSSANIGTLSTFVVSKSIGRGASYDIPSFVEKNSSVNWVITLGEDYTFGTYSVTMGSEVVTPTVVDNVMTISIAEVTGNVRIVVATVNENTGEEDGPVVPPVEPEEPDTPQENCIDITDSIVFNKTGQAYQYSNGLTKTSTYFDSTDLIDISQYSANYLNTTIPSYTDSTNVQCPYAIIMFDDNKTMVNNIRFPKYTDNGPKGTYVEINEFLPSNVKYIALSKFNSAANNGIFEGDDTYFVKLCNYTYETTAVDITNMFVFNKLGVAQRTETSGGSVSLGDYTTQYWNSAIVDISEYQGNTITITTPIWNTSQNIQGPYGFLTEDENGYLTKLHTFNRLNGINGLGGDVEIMEFAIPLNAKYLRVCYYSDSMKNATNPISDEILNGFYCLVNIKQITNN